VLVYQFLFSLFPDSVLVGPTHIDVKALFPLSYFLLLLVLSLLLNILLDLVFLL
jgi:hypothetical protein